MSTDQTPTRDAAEGDRPQQPPLWLVLAAILFLIAIGAYAYSTIGHYRDLADEKIGETLSEKYGVEVVKTEPFGKSGETTTWRIDGTERECILDKADDALRCETPDGSLVEVGK